MMSIGQTADGKPFTLPSDAVTQKFAFLAQSGAGKSYAAMKLAEAFLTIGAQIIALDPVGVWWGLRVAADGKKAGFPIAVFGGDYGDLPLPATSGALVADLLVEHRIGAVLDVSAFELPDQRRFVAAFAERFFQAKKRARSPVHLFLEEAQTFAPLRPERDETVMLNRVERLARLGRNYGVGWSVISQRPQEVHTKVRNQAGTLIAMRTIGPHERKAVAEWMNDNATTPADLDLVNDLPTLETGEAHIYSPSFLKISTRIRIGRRQTFDSSATPEDGITTAQPRPLAPADLEALRQAMQQVVQEAEARDPVVLQRKIVQLEKELRAKAKVERVVERVEVPVLQDEQITQLQQAISSLADMGQQLVSVAQDLGTALARVVSSSAPPPVSAPSVSPPEARPTSRHVKPSPAPRRADSDIPQLRAGERRMLETLARRYPLRVTRAQLGTLAGFTPSGGTFGTYFGTLKRAGLIEESSGEIQVTQAGLDYLGYTTPPAPQTTEEILAMWREALRAGERKMLDELVAVYPDSLSREELGTRAGFTVSGGTFGTYLGTLRRNGLVEVDGDQVRASETLFLS
ncbi:MAG: ATP-binding protein [Anaerolineales bacterium]|nr:ATP-binding protein [Anaerolineales bacterium]